MAEFQGRGVPTEVADAVYDYYRAESVARSLTIAPADSLRTLFGRSDEDVDHDALMIIRKLGLALPSEEVLRSWPHPLGTIQDMVLWVDWIGQYQGRVTV